VELDKYSVAQKMSWVAGHQTTRREDIAYRVLGIFNVNMPLLYREGEKAFLRWQEEIIRLLQIAPSSFGLMARLTNTPIVVSSPEHPKATRSVLTLGTQGCIQVFSQRYFPML
jgi:hypothetical protein